MIPKKIPYLLKNLCNLRNLWILFTIHYTLFTITAYAQEANIRYQARYLFSIDGKTSGSPFSGISEIYIDNERGEIYTIEGGNKRRIVITSLKGIFLHQFTFGSAGIKADPVSLVVDKKGDIYIAESQRIFILNYRGVYKREVDLSTIPDSDDLSIQSIALDSDGRLYIGDAAKGRVIVLDKDKKFLFQFGKKGYGEGQFLNAMAINVDAEKIYCLDSAIFRVSVFDKEGRFLFSFGRASSLLGGFAMPVDMAVDSRGRILVVDANRFQVIMFNKLGVPLFEFGGPRLFYWPGMLEINRDGRIYVADASKKIRVFEVIEEKR